MPGMDGDLLVSILSFLPPRELGPARAVSCAWREAAAAALVASFQKHWQLSSLSAAMGAPRRSNFLVAATLQSFVTPHKVARTDSFLSLAVRYGVEPTAIKRVNNMISDHSLHSRIVVYIPVASAEQLKGRVVQLRYCSAAKRDVAVVLQESNDDLDALMQSTRAHEAKAQAEALRVKMSQLLGRSMRVDGATALFYIDEAGGDLKRAMSEAEQDAAWEDKTAGPIRTAPVQRWIEGDDGF